MADDLFAGIEKALNREIDNENQIARCQTKANHFPAIYGFEITSDNGRKSQYTLDINNSDVDGVRSTVTEGVSSVKEADYVFALAEKDLLSLASGKKSIHSAVNEGQLQLQDSKAGLHSLPFLVTPQTINKVPRL